MGYLIRIGGSIIQQTCTQALSTNQQLGQLFMKQIVTTLAKAGYKESNKRKRSIRI